MDEVITCNCGGQMWVIGTSGIRCGKCDYWLPKECNLNQAISYVNSLIYAQDKREETESE